ncbi:class I SAM-dependent methyltransferase [Pseudomonas sp. PDM25]|nr:class I SAM-dependent methyltransferase [Pseudomonas sp. PDM25]MBV7515686.1 class I SAM-dependent methyltransferase [Pseudomonas sp. PDM25]
MNGVDISPETIHLARLTEDSERNDIEYIVCDCATLSGLGEFDIVTAVYLLNYTESRDRLLAMLKVICRHLIVGGSFVAYTVNANTLSMNAGNFAKYGVEVISDQPAECGHNCEALFVTTPPTNFNYFKWSRETHDGRYSRLGSRRFHGSPRRSLQKIWPTMLKNIGIISIRTA